MISGARNKLVVSLAAFVILACVAAAVIGPYSRLERLADQMFTEHAPPGASVGEIDLGFPATITLLDLAMPVNVNGQQRQVLFEKVFGDFSILSLLRGKMRAEVNADFFGGDLWLKVLADPAVGDAASNDSRASLEARARKVDISELCRFLDSSHIVSGLGDADVEAEMNTRDITKLEAQALVMGEQIALPPLPTETLIMPACRDARLTAQLQASNGTLTISSLRFTGSAYDLVGQGTLALTNPPERGAVKGTFRITFQEPPIITDHRLVRMGADGFANSLAASRTEIPLRLYGTLKKPKLELDPASLGTFLQHLNGS
jgi:type II secretion system protein N